MNISVNNSSTADYYARLPIDDRFSVLLHWCEWLLLWEPRKAGFAAAHHKFAGVVLEMREAEARSQDRDPASEAEQQPVARDEHLESALTENARLHSETRSLREQLESLRAAVVALRDAWYLGEDTCDERNALFRVLNPADFVSGTTTLRESVEFKIHEQHEVGGGAPPSCTS